MTLYIHSGSTSDSIPETPVMLMSRATSRTSVSKISSKHEQDFCSPCGSVTDPITIADGDSSDDSEQEIVPLCKRIGIGSEKSLTPSQAAGGTRLTPSQAAGAAAIKRLSAMEKNGKRVEASTASAVGSWATDYKQITACHADDRGSSGSTRELLQHGPSTSGGIPNSSGRRQAPHQSTTADRHVDLGSPQFVLLPGNLTRYDMYVLYDIVFFVNVLLGEFEVILCVDNSESTASRKYCDTQYTNYVMFYVCVCASDLSVPSGHPLSSEGFSLLTSAKMVSCPH